MICPNCSSDQIIVSNSRPTGKDTQIWRRRKCLKCNFIFTTHEKIDLSHITVIKKNEKKVRYIGIKLYSSIYNSVVQEKKIDKGEASILAQNIFDKVEENIILNNKDCITTSEISNLVLKNILPDNLGTWLRYLAYTKSGTKKLTPALVRRQLFQNHL